MGDFNCNPDTTESLGWMQNLNFVDLAIFFHEKFGNPLSPTVGHSFRIDQIWANANALAVTNSIHVDGISLPPKHMPIKIQTPVAFERPLQWTRSAPLKLNTSQIKKLRASPFWQHHTEKSSKVLIEQLNNQSYGKALETLNNIGSKTLLSFAVENNIESGLNNCKGVHHQYKTKLLRPLRKHRAVHAFCIPVERCSKELATIEKTINRVVQLERFLAKEMPRFAFQVYI